MDKVIKTTPVITKINITKRGEFTTFSVSVPPNIKKITGIIVLSSLSSNPIETTNKYYGIGDANQNTSAFIITLTSKQISSKSTVFTANAGIGKHVYYAVPRRIGRSQFTINAIKGGFKNPVIISVTDPETGFIEDYYLYESIDENLGEVRIEVS
jgi:hypothetical protein